MAAGAVQWVTIALPVPTGKVTGDRTVAQGGGTVAGGPSHAAVHVCMERGVVLVLTASKVHRK